MLKSIVNFSLLLFILISCQASFKDERSHALSLTEIEEAKKWCIHTIEAFFYSEDGDTQWLEDRCTEEYFTYKTDALTSAFDGSKGNETLVKFNEKWGEKFQNHEQAMHSGFFISAQDWTNIEVHRINQEKQKNAAVLFDIQLLDTEFNVLYPIKVEVEKVKGKYLIANVIEN